MVYRALSEVERLSRFVQLDEGHLASARSFLLLYSDCRNSETMYRQRLYFAEQASFLASTGGEFIADLMALASIVLSHESFDSSLQSLKKMPRTWFLNLENLFENSVRRVLQSVVVSASVLRGGQLGRHVFDKGSGIYKANPDLVITSQGRKYVGDVKYKNIEGKASTGDVYQLLAHAEAFDAIRTFLIFPGENFEIQTVGATRRGITMHVFTVRIEHLVEDLGTVADVLGLIPQSNPEVNGVMPMRSWMSAIACVAWNLAL